VYWVHWEDYDSKHDIEHFNHALKLLESYHYMYFNRFYFIIIIIQNLFTTEIQFKLIIHDLLFNYIFTDHCQDNLLCTIDIIWENVSWNACLYVKKHSNNSLLIQIRFCWEKLIQLWEKNSTEQFKMCCMKEKVLSDVMTE
jgi:hypothetical protein